MPGIELKNNTIYTDVIKIINRNKEVVWEYVYPKAGVDSVSRFSLDEVDCAEKLSVPKQENKFFIKVPNKVLWVIILILIIGLLVSLRSNKKESLER